MLNRREFVAAAAAAGIAAPTLATPTNPNKRVREWTGSLFGSECSMRVVYEGPGKQGMSWLFEIASVQVKYTHTDCHIMALLKPDTGPHPQLVEGIDVTSIRLYTETRLYRYTGIEHFEIASPRQNPTILTAKCLNMESLAIR